MQKGSKPDKKDRRISLEMDVRLLGERSCHLAAVGYSIEEVAGTIREVVKALPPIGEREIALIEANTSLSWLQKRRLIREIRNGFQAGRREHGHARDKQSNNNRWSGNRSKR